MSFSLGFSEDSSRVALSPTARIRFLGAHAPSWKPSRP